MRDRCCVITPLLLCRIGLLHESEEKLRSTAGYGSKYNHNRVAQNSIIAPSSMRIGRRRFAWPN